MNKEVLEKDLDIKVVRWKEKRNSENVVITGSPPATTDLSTSDGTVQGVPA
jgi:hypothetical protein